MVFFNNCIYSGSRNRKKIHASVILDILNRIAMNFDINNIMIYQSIISTILDCRKLGYIRSSTEKVTIL